MSTVLSLCDLTGNFVRPWVDAGHDAILVDPQHGMDHDEKVGDATITKLALTVDEALEVLAPVLRRGEVVFVAGWPPCTDLAVSGALHHDRKMTDEDWEHYRGPGMFFDACRVAWQCETIGRLSGAPWFVENPVSRLSSLWRKPDHTFHPYQYTLLEPGDNYTKKTCLWAGGGFKLPPTQRDLTLGVPDDRIHKASPGEDRANIRSVTPMGFARAVYAANKPRTEVAA